MGAIETAAIRAACSALPIVGRRIYSKRQQARIISTAESIFIGDKTEEFIESLDARQIRRIKNFVESPQFGHLTLQAMTNILADQPTDTNANLREQLRLSLTHEGVFSSGDLFQAVDMLQELLHSSVHCVLSSTPEPPRKGYALAIASQVASAGARNSDLLARVETIDNFNKFANKLRAQVLALHSKLTLPSVIAHARSVNHAELYVPPALRDPDDGDSKIDPVTVLRQQPRVAILGDPGAGKSTLAAKLAHDLAADKIDGLNKQVPLLLIVRDHTDSLRSEHETLLHYLQASCRQPYGVAPNADTLEYLLLNGRATVIIDGIDELGDSRFRATFAKMVEAFTSLYPLTRIVATSRAIGYQEAPLDGDLFPIALIAPFNRSQVETYARKWFKLDRSLTKAQHESLLRSFLDESSQISDLRSNPLMLSLLCVLYSSERFLPQNKPEIFHKCAEVLFETWDRSRGIEVPLRFRSHVKPAVQRLAWHMFNDPKGRQELPKSEIQRFLTTSVLSSRYEDEDEAALAADEFLEFCAGRAWVLTEIGSNRLQPLYGFTHRTFLEYFTAAQLVKQEPHPDVVWGKLKGHLEDGAWEVVSQLAIQILERDCEGGANRVLELILGEADKSFNEGKTAASLLSFAARCLEVVVPDSGILRRIVHKCTELASLVPADSRLLSGDTEPELLADEPLITLLRGDKTENAPRIIRSLADSIEYFARSLPTASSAGIIYNRMLDLFPVTTSIAFAAEVANTLEARTTPDAARLWDRLLNDLSPTLLAEYGIELIYRDLYFAGVTHGSQAEVLARSATTSYLRESVRLERVGQLEAIYPTLVSTELTKLRQIALPSAFYDMLHDPDELDEPRSDSLDSLSPIARAAALLLLIPAFEAFDFSAVKDQRIRCVATARKDESRREAAIQAVNEWVLPQQGHDLIIQWILTTEDIDS